MVTVLYVENDPEVRNSTIHLLTLVGHHTVKAVSDGLQGLEVLAGDDKIDIILAGFIMDSYDFSKAVKTNPKYARHSAVPIVGVGDFPFDMREHLVECMPEPYDPRRLLKCIDELCK